MRFGLTVAPFFNLAWDGTFTEVPRRFASTHDVKDANNKGHELRGL